MIAEDFSELVARRQACCRQVLEFKAGEYAPDDDRLSNFKTAAMLQSATPERALAGMLAKHVVALFDFIRTGETDTARWEEKLTDTHNYLYLLEALLHERLE